MARWSPAAPWSRSSSTSRPRVLEPMQSRGSMKTEFMFTSESVTEGHPDKVCDQISDAIIDRFLEQDPHSRVIAECAVSNTILFIASRFASRATVDFPGLARKVIKDIGYDYPEFNNRTCSVLTSL